MGTPFRFAFFKGVLPGLTFVLVCFLTETATAQNSPTQNSDAAFGQVSIASPNAAALGKFEDIPVSYHTGIPNISIPLYTLTEGSLAVPVGVSYHAGGLKVDETSSNVGLGWALNAGGVITRTVRDRPDEKQTASSVQTYGFFSDYGVLGQYRASGTMWGIQPGQGDGEPDLFFFNFNGHSGKFFFGDDRTPTILPKTDLKIEYSYQPGIWNSSPGAWGQGFQNISAFTITTPDGTKYYFGIPSTPVNSAAGYCDPIEVVSNYTQSNGTGLGQVISSWYLNKIVSADGNSVITFSYVRDRFATYSYVNPDILAFSISGGNNANPYSLVKNLNAGARLRRIQGSTVNVDFLPGMSRKDLSQWVTFGGVSLIDSSNFVATAGDTVSSTALGAIQVATRGGTCIKKFVFNQDYFVDAAGETVHTNFSGLTYDKKKLRLNSIQEMSCDGTVTVPPYTFQYFSERVPRSFSFGRDHWGFINGVTSNPSLYPQLMSGVYDVNASSNIGVADRSSHWPAMRGGALSRITYPTGGYASFNFEPNAYTIARAVVNGQPTGTDVIVGGLRIKSIDHYDPVSNATMTTSYSYLGQGSTFSSGTLFSQPVYIQLFWNDLWALSYYWAPAQVGCLNPAVSYSNFIMSDRPLRQMATTQGSHIGYSQVVVSQTGNGQNVYQYSGASVITNNTTLAITSVPNPVSCSWSANYPAAPPADDFMRGELSYEGAYDQSGNILHEKFYYPNYIPTGWPVLGMSSYVIGDGTLYPTAYTYYYLQTSVKTQDMLVEKNYQAGGTVQIDTTITSYGSAYHLQPTMITKSTPDGRSAVKKITYTFDLRVPTENNTPTCVPSDGNITNYNIPNYMDYAYSVQGYHQAFENSWSGNSKNVAAWSTAMAGWMTAVSNYWNPYTDCRKTNYTNADLTNLNKFQINHNAGKIAADATLSPILWAQDAYINAPIEVTTWRGSSLSDATYTTYQNTRNDAFGVVPKKTSKIDLSTLSSAFSPAVLNTNGTAVVLDTRYADDVQAGFVFGHVSRVTKRDGVPNSYDWGFNTYPTVKASNASNNLYETPATVTYSPTFSTSNNLQFAYSFYQTIAGQMTLSVPQPPAGVSVTMTYSLVGASNSIGSSGYNTTSSICNNSSGSCGASSVTLSSVPAGQYLLTYTITPSYNSGVTPFNFNQSISFTYQGATATSTKEYFFEGFEENTNASVVNGSSHTGSKYWNGNYTASFTIPNGRSYTIQWWNLSGGQWVFNQQSYTGSVVLTGPVDDVRIFPSDALMETYTHQPGIGATSQTDAAGVTTYYHYDKLGRLAYVTDQFGKIVKQYNYNYSH